MTLRAITAMGAATWLVASALSPVSSQGLTTAVATPRGQTTANPAATVAPTPTGTGSIVGTVVSAASGKPIHGARVQVNGAPGGPRMAMSDPQGQFTLTTLPAGRFLVDASHGAFLPASYGQRTPGKAGTPIELTEGQRVEIQVRMHRGSAITGTVFDDVGEPLVRGRVQALQYYVNQNGVRGLRLVTEVWSDDRGAYRLFNLPPGDYLIAARPLPFEALDTLMTAEQTAELEAQVLEMFRSMPDDSPGGLGGFSFAFGADVELTGEPAAPEYETFAPTYHPMSTSAARAVTIRADGTSEHAGIDVRVLPVLNGTIRGTVVGIPTPAVPVQLLLHQTDAAEAPTSLTAIADPVGAFTFHHVPPGQYVVYAQTLPGSGRNVSFSFGQPAAEERDAALEFFRNPVVGTASFDRLHGRAPVVVDGPDTPPIAITLRPGRSISGRVALDFTQAPATAVRAGTTISIVPSPQAAGWPAFNTLPQVQADADGNFTLPGIRPGRYFLRASGPGTVKSVVWNGLDTLDFPLEVTPDDDVNGVIITLTDRPSELSGIVTDASGKPSTEGTVLAIATDSRYWVYGSRRVAAAQPAGDGRYTFRGLPPGEYSLTVITDYDPSSRFDINFLQQHSRSSVTVTVAEAGRHVQNLRLP